jgi:putative ABC transport system permease protein
VIGLGLFTFRAALPVHFDLPERYGTYGAILFTFLGAVVATAALSAFVARLLRPLVRAFLGVEELLAADNLVRAPGRTGLVIASLAAFVALMLQTAGVTLSSRNAVLSWVDNSISADLFVTANSPVTASGASLEMDEGLGRRFEALPEIDRAVPVRFRQKNFRTDQVFVIALDAANFHKPDQISNPVRGLESLRYLTEPGTVIVSENFAVLHGVGQGDPITLQGPRGEVNFRIIDTVLDYSWNRGTIVMDREQYRDQFQDDLVNVFDLYVRPESTQANLKLLAGLSVAPQAAFPANLPWNLLRQEPQTRSVETVREDILRRWGAEETLVVMTRAKLRDSIGEMVDKLYGIGYAQEAVVGMVAAMGVVTSLLISVLQRRREIGLLRAVGASQGQVLRSVLAEAVLMGVIGAACGFVIGIPMEWYAVRVILLEEAGFNFPVSVPWTAAAVVTGLALLIAAVAGLFPAVHAIRLRIADAIAYE